MKEVDMELIASLIKKVIHKPQDESVIDNVRREVIELTKRFPVE